LCIFKLDDENIEDVISLARYAYREEGKGSEEGIGSLRGMVCRYMASNTTVLSLMDLWNFLRRGANLLKIFLGS
jgi:hypothetical protein